MAMDKEIDSNNRRQSESTGKLMEKTTPELDRQIRHRLYDVRETINNHVQLIHTSVMENVKQTIKFLQNMQKSSDHITKRRSGNGKWVLLDPAMYKIRQLWDEVASTEEEYAENGFGTAFSYQPTESKTQITKLEPIRRNAQKVAKQERMEPKAEQKPRLKITKGEEEELMSILSKSHLLETLPRLTRNDEKIVKTSSKATSPTLPPPVVTLTLIDRKIQRYRRSADDKMVNGPLLTNHS